MIIDCVGLVIEYDPDGVVVDIRAFATPAMAEEVANLLSLEGDGSGHSWESDFAEIEED